MALVAFPEEYPTSGPRMRLVFHRNHLAQVPRPLTVLQPSTRGGPKLTGMVETARMTLMKGECIHDQQVRRKNPKETRMIQSCSSGERGRGGGSHTNILNPKLRWLSIVVVAVVVSA
eukprot:9413873-Pyramimonas_sp.AAC.1